MALQIKGKFVENAAIDGDKIELKVGQSLKQKKADGNLSELIKLDESITEGSKVRVDGQQVALKSEVDGLSTQVATQTQALIAAETAARIADVNAEEARALAAESALSAAITAEEAARIAGDSSTLSSANNYTDTKIAALVDAAPALLDTLNELADALGDDPNFATSIANSVAAVQTAVETEETRALAAESALQAEIDTEELARATADTALQAEVDAVESALAQELIDREAGDASTLSSANSYTDTEVGAEEARAVAAEAAIQAEVDAVEAALATETSVREAADAALDGRVDALEAVAHYKEKFVMPSTVPAFIELEREAKSNSIVASVGRLMIHQGEGEDFTVSVVAGKTRMTFVGNLINPSPEELGEGDVIYVKYMA